MSEQVRIRQAGASKGTHIVFHTRFQLCHIGRARHTAARRRCVGSPQTRPDFEWRTTEARAWLCPVSFCGSCRAGVATFVEDVPGEAVFESSDASMWTKEGARM